MSIENPPTGPGGPGDSAEMRAKCPQVPSEFMERLSRVSGADAQPAVDLEKLADALGPAYARMSKRTEPGTARERYVFQRELGRGGMGIVYRAFDSDLRRSLAIKVLRVREGDDSKEAVRHDTTRLMRFLEEAQVTGQLDHPGIVPVHELGIDSQGRVYFTMRMVRGKNLEHIFELVREGKDGWTETRALHALLKACEAMAYAHDKGVVHRDLKPSNIMVGKYGEVYVMDWGLARIAGCPDRHDLRPGTSVSLSIAEVRTDRQDLGRKGDQDELTTQDGTILGTPCYMSPEQAAGRIEEVDARSDVYSVGAILYHLLTGHMPYCESGKPAVAQLLLLMALMGPPKSVHQLAPDVSAELEAICAKAMAREKSRRYASMSELAEDLRAYLERRVVRAYETGATAEFRKWVVRNKGMATAIAAALVAVVAGLASSRSVEASQKREIDYRSDFYRLRYLVAAADELWPAHPETAPRLEEWLKQARLLLERKSVHTDRLRKTDARARRTEEGELVFEDEDDAFLHDQQVQLMAGLDDLSGSAIDAGIIGRIEERLRFARGVEGETVSGERARLLWSEAIASIRDETRSPAYVGSTIVPQLGLLPIGQDPESGLWEFAHLQSGKPALRDAKGHLVLTEETGMVFVLLPGGTFTMGARPPNSPEERGPNVDLGSTKFEGPPHAVTLAPFFISKYELAQAQWVRIAGSNPSFFQPGSGFGDKPFTLLHPVENVSWSDCQGFAQKLAFLLPTEAQWEYAARAGTTSVWSTGDEKESLEDVANLRDLHAKNFGGVSYWIYEEWLDDGYVAHSPIGIYRANPFGLHDVHGNVWEWCRESFDLYPNTTEREGDGERATTRDTRSHIFRGGAYYNPAEAARCAYRYEGPGFPHAYGLRLVRALELE